MTKKMTSSELHDLQISERDSLIEELIRQAHTVVYGSINMIDKGKATPEQVKFLIDSKIADTCARIVSCMEEPLSVWTEHMDIEIID